MIGLFVECASRVKGRAVAEAASHIEAGFDPRLHHVEYVVEKVALGQVVSEYVVNSASSYYTDCFL